MYPKKRHVCLAVALLALCPVLGLGAPSLDSGNVVRNASAIVPQPDGKVVAAGVPAGDGSALLLVRLNADGTLDATFNAGGLALLMLDSISLLPSGQFLVAGTFSSGEALVKLNADGTVDATFEPGAQYAPDPLIQPDGRLLLLGEVAAADGTGQPTLTRLNADGSLDATYHPGAVLVADGAYDLRLQPDGKLLVLGEDGAASGQPALQRLNADGSLDPAFQAAAPVSGSDGVCSLAVAPDGKLLVAAYAGVDAGTVTLSRLQPDGSLDPAFAAPAPLDGTVDQLAVDDTGRVVLAGDFTQVNGVDRAGFARLQADGSLDAVFDPLSGYTGNFDEFTATPAGSIIFARALTAAENDDATGAPGALLERIGTDGSSASAVKIASCPSCRLVPAATGPGVYVLVASASAEPIDIIAPPPSPGGPIVKPAPFVSIESIRPRVYGGSPRKGIFLLTRTGDLSSKLTVHYLTKGSAVAGRDYYPLRGARTIRAGQAHARIRIKPIRRYFRRAGGGRVAVKLVLAPADSYEIGAPSYGRVRIMERPPN